MTNKELQKEIETLKKKNNKQFIILLTLIIFLQQKGVPLKDITEVINKAIE